LNRTVKDFFRFYHACYTIRNLVPSYVTQLRILNNKYANIP